MQRRAGSAAAGAAVVNRVEPAGDEAFAGEPAPPISFIDQLLQPIQRKAAGGDGPDGDVYERHADAVADAVVRGASAAPLLAAGPTGAAGAVQRKAPGAGGAPPKEPADELPPDRDYQRLAGSMSFLVRRSWLESEPEPRAGGNGTITPTRTRTLLDELVRAGLLGWARPDRLTLAANRLVLLGAGAGQAVVRVSMGAGVYNIIGLPPGTGAMVSRRQGGLELTVQAEGLEADGVEVPLDATQLGDALDAVERFTGLAIPTARRSDIVINARGGTGTFNLFLSAANMADLVGADAWRAYRERDGAADGARGVGSAAASVNGDLTDLELGRAKDWLRTHLPASKDEGVRIDRALLELILTIERSPHKARIVAALAGSEGGAALTAISFESIMNEATFEAERDASGVTTPRPTANLDPVHDTPLPARIVQHASKIAAGDTVPFTIEVDWPPVFIDRAEGNEYRYRQFVTHVDWVFEKSTTHEKAFARQRYTGGHDAQHHVFQLAPGEDEATWIVHAFVRHSHFAPTHEQRAVVVQTEAALMRDLRADATQGMGVLDQEGAKNFDTGVVNNHAGSTAQDQGLELHGRLPRDFKPKSDSQRGQGRDQEMDQVRAVIAHLRGRDIHNDDAIEAAERYLANLVRADRAIEADLRATWQSFEVRGTLRSSQAGVDDGALQLHGAVRWGSDGSVEVQLRDLSRRFGAEDLRTEGSGATFASALEGAFVPLCKAYPAGRLFVLAQDHQGMNPLPTTIGFELDTGTIGEDIKAKVWDPAVKMAVNVAGMVATLAGFGAIAIPLLVVYNGLETIDQIHEEYQRGTLTSTDVGLGLGSLVLDLLPAAGGIKAVGSSARLMYALHLADLAGEALYMTAAAHHAINDLEELHVVQLVERWERMTELQRTTDAADPAMIAMRAEFDAQAEKVKEASTGVLLALVRDRAIFVAAKHLAMGGGGPKVGTPYNELHRDGLVVATVGGEPYYDPARGQIVGDPNRMKGPRLEGLQAEHANHMRLMATQLAERLGLPITDVEVMVGDRVGVTIGTSGSVTATYQPGMPPAKAQASWQELYDEKMEARGGGAGGPGRGRLHLPAGEPGDGRPRRNREQPHGEIHRDPGATTPDAPPLPTPYRHDAKHELDSSTELSIAIRQQWAEVEVLLSAGAPGSRGVPIGRVLETAAEGHRLFQRIVRRDRGVLDDLGMQGVPKDFDTMQQEWSLIETSDGFVIVAGDYGNVTAPGRVRVLAHVHPAPLKAGSEGATTTTVLDVRRGGKSYDQILLSEANAKQSGITPSAEDIHSISDGGAHVLYTRYVNEGNGLIGNPQPDDPRPRIEIHMAGVQTRRWNSEAKKYVYEVDVRVKDSDGEILWVGKMFANWNAVNKKGNVHFTSPDSLADPLEKGWKEL